MSLMVSELNSSDDGSKRWKLRDYVSTIGYRTAISDKHFNNPHRNGQSKYVKYKWR